MLCVELCVFISCSSGFRQFRWDRFVQSVCAVDINSEAKADGIRCAYQVSVTRCCYHVYQIWTRCICIHGGVWFVLRICALCERGPPRVCFLFRATGMRFLPRRACLGFPLLLLVAEGVSRALQPRVRETCTCGGEHRITAHAVLWPILHSLCWLRLVLRRPLLVLLGWPCVRISWCLYVATWVRFFISVFPVSFGFAQPIAVAGGFWWSCEAFSVVQS